MNINQSESSGTAGTRIKKSLVFNTGITTKSVATQISHDAGWASISYIDKKFIPHQRLNQHHPKQHALNHMTMDGSGTTVVILM